MTAIPECGTVVCVTSAVSNEGKSVLSASLARTMALSGDRVLIIDCDLRRNGLAGLLKSRPQAGLREVLNGACLVDDAIVRDAVSGVDIIPLAAAKFLPEDVFSDGRMELLLGDMRSRYDFIVLDAPPVLIVDEAARLGRLADKVLLAVRWGSTRWDALRVAVDRLQECRVDLLGIVLTAVNPRMNLALGYRDPHYYQSISTGYHLN
jgi:capsular exopolysaccharide synthesis family protein